MPPVIFISKATAQLRRRLVQGVLIPAANARDLMLDQELVDAVARGRFRIWTFGAVLDGLELLTGLSAGEVLDRARRRLDRFRREVDEKS